MGAPRRDLEESGSAWFQEVSGQLALVNHVDGRFGIDSGREGVDLILGGYRRGTASIPALHLGRVCNQTGEPLGYELLKGVDQLSEQWKGVFAGLPDRFRHKDVCGQVGW